MIKGFLKTKIVMTVGPACKKIQTLRALIRTGVSVVRINASHTDFPELTRWIGLVRQAAEKESQPVAVLVDLQGPRIRTGSLLAHKPLNLCQGDRVILMSSAKPGSGKKITTPCRHLGRWVKRGEKILLDNGAIELSVLAARSSQVFCRVVSGGTLGENKGINLPDTEVPLPALTKKDRRDLKAACKAKTDYIALSFVRNADNIRVARQWMKRRGYDVPIIAKIEKPAAVTHLEEILKAADGIMVARGDLGIELGVEKVPVIQKQIIERANAAGLPVITATQMLESMMEHTYPTRAEASDVANAVFDRTDAVMLSGETAIGKYPLRTVQIMKKIIGEAEQHLHTNRHQVRRELAGRFGLSLAALAHGACDTAADLGAKALVVFTLTGRTALAVSKLKPVPPVIGLTLPENLRRLALYYGVCAVPLKYCRSTDEMFRLGERRILSGGLLHRGDCVVMISGRQGPAAAQYMSKIHCLGGK